MSTNNPESRYYNVPTLFVDGREVLDVRERSTPTYFAFRRYRTKESERISHLGQRFFESERQWWALADLNPELLYPQPDSGKRVRVPTSNRP